MKETLGLIKPLNVLMKPKVSNSFLTLYGGSVSRFFRLWPNRAVWCVYRKIKIGTYNKANKAYMAFEQDMSGAFN